MYKKQLPLMFTFLAGLIPILAFFITTPKDYLQQANDTLELWMLVVAGFALLLGVVNVFQMNLKKISNKSKGWLNALWLLLSLIIAAVFGVLDAFDIVPFQVDGLDIFRWITESVFMPLQSTMFSLLAFYVASASFRAFRARNVDAAMLLAAALIIMLGVYLITTGMMAFLSDLTTWNLNVPNPAAQRGILIGAALGRASRARRIF
ncbi:hypothetical protein H8E52_12780, partial [bacterium]|nr:hypothetical protein [bacterium]